MTHDVSDARRATFAGEEAHDGGSVYKTAGFHMCRKQSFDLGPTLGVCTGMLKKRNAFVLRSLERCMKERLEMSPPIV